MKEFASIDDVLEFAIGEEEQAAAFYTAMAARMTQPWMQEVFADFAKEEQGHKAKLEAIRAGEEVELGAATITDLKLADYLIADPVSPEMDYAGALIVAMKKEKAAFRLYSDLARAYASDERVRDLFRSLAQEEAKHKLYFEVQYDEVVYQEN